MSKLHKIFQAVYNGAEPNNKFEVSSLSIEEGIQQIKDLMLEIMAPAGQLIMYKNDEQREFIENWYNKLYKKVAKL